MNTHWLLPIIIALSAVTRALGHGTAVYIDVVDGRLIASHGSDMFAPPIVGQGDDSDDFTDIVALPGLGDVIVWDSPSLEIHGMTSSSSLAIEVLPRPVVGGAPDEYRTLWYWNPASEAVEPTSGEFHLLGTGARFLTLPPTPEIDLPSLELAATVEGQTGFHNHGLLLYGLDHTAISAPGVYGFFARFTSNQFAPSDPTLLVFNLLTEHEQVVAGSLAIHTAATVPGDLDGDHDVDGRDLLVWQRLLGSTTRTVADASLNGVVDAADLVMWQENYGASLVASKVSTSVAMPEPSTLIGVWMLLSATLIGRSIAWHSRYQ